MKLEVGKSYRTRDGEKVTIVKKDNDDLWPFISNENFSYTITGRFYDHSNQSECDLISEWLEPVKNDILISALKSIADSSCCCKCQEAALIAKNALKILEPEFDWDTVQSGFAFTGTYEGVKYYVGVSPQDKNYVILEGLSGSIYKSWPQYLKRSPENDLKEVK